MRTRLGELAILLAASVACVFFAELACRVFLPRWKPPYTVDGMFRYDTLLGWVQVPDRSTVFKIIESTTTVSVNSQGLRDREYAFARSPDKRRMLVLGDSMTWGWGVEADESFSERLEALHPDWEFINAGVPGYSTDQELVYFEHAGQRWDPDAVLLLFHPNDALENERGAQSWHSKPGFELIDRKLTPSHEPVPEPSFGQTMARYLRANTYLLWRVQIRLTHWLSSDVPVADGPLAPDGPEVDYLLTMKLLLALDEQVQKAGSRLLVASVPMLGETNQKIERSVAKTLAYARVPYQPLSASFATRFDQLMFEGNGHWNAAGHAVAADTIDAFLREQGVFDPPAVGSRSAGSGPPM